MPVTVGSKLSFEDVVAVAAHGAPVEIAPGVPSAMARSRGTVDEAVREGRTVYGITTGIGDLANVRIPPPEAEALQRDIVRSHATGVGAPLPEAIVRAMLLLKARTLAFGNSGVRFEIVEQLVSMLNNRVHPYVPSQGSLGASGDLAPLAHLALPVMGEGMVTKDGAPVDAAAALVEAGLRPLPLSYKEGLSLVNGTEMMLSYGILTFQGAATVARTADVTAAMTVEACLGTDQAFRADLITLRRNAGPQLVAENMRALLDGSEIVASHRASEHLVQDAYSLRCVPQVHGAYRDGLAYVRATFEAELASIVDNPSVLGHEVLSSGNFHGEALALALDHLTLCVSGYATIAERRVARIVDPNLNNGLPAFLTTDPGRRSGFMLAQYTAAALVSENRTLCFPASADSIPTSAGQEDHVSMGATAARKAAAALANTEHVLAIEALVAAQGLDLRAPLQPGRATAAAREAVRAVSPALDRDRPTGPDIANVRAEIAAGALLGAVEAAVGPLS